MSSHTPLVSVAVITFNHEKYIGDAVRSVLTQTCPDLELVIVDDGSADGTAQVIAGFSDPRIVAIRQENQGPGAAFNRALAACRGRYIALLGGDDVCHADRLEAQLQAYQRAGKGVVYSDMDYIDDVGNAIESCHIAKDFFAAPALSRAQILERFFHRGNFVASPTCFGEAQTLRGAGPFDPLLYQTQDFDWAIRLVKQHELTFMPRSTVHYRLRSGNANLSAPDPRKKLRTSNEIYLLLRRFFDGLSPDLFREAFREHFSYPDSRSPLELACEQAFLYLRHPHFVLARLIGMEKLHALLQDPEASAVLLKHHRLDTAGFADLLLHIDVLDQLSRYQTQLFVDTGKGFNASECCRTLGNHLAPTFELSYDMSAFSHVRGLRWDPVEFQPCRVRLEEVSWRDRAGGEHVLDLAHVESNGQRGTDGGFTFQTLEPMILLPITGDIAHITLRGRWQMTEPLTSRGQINTLLLAREQQVQDLTRELQAILNSRTWRCLSRIRSVLPFRGRRRAG